MACDPALEDSSEDSKRDFVPEGSQDLRKNVSSLLTRVCKVVKIVTELPWLLGVGREDR